MNLILPPGTSSSTGAPLPNPSSSASPSSAGAQNASAQSAGQPGIDWHELIKDWAIPALLAIITGIIGFYSSVFMLSDKISEAKNETSKNSVIIESISNDINDIKGEQKKIQQLEIELAVIKTKIERRR
jgi:hypothetical protein